MKNAIKSYIKFDEIADEKIKRRYSERCFNLFDVEIFISSKDFIELKLEGKELGFYRPLHICSDVQRCGKLRKLKGGVIGKWRHGLGIYSKNYGLKSGIYDIEVVHHHILKDKTFIRVLAVKEETPIPELKYTCPECGGLLNVDGTYGYYGIECEKCGYNFEVPYISKTQAINEFNAFWKKIEGYSSTKLN